MSGEQVTAIDLSPVVGGVTFVAVGLWYVRANRSWTRLLRSGNPGLVYDPIRDPVGWVTGGPYRVRTWLARLRVRDESPAVEYWRVRTVNRFVVWIGLFTFAFLAGDTFVRHVATFARASIERYGSGFGILSIVVFGGMLSIYSVRLGRALFEYGNGRRPTGLGLVLAVGGIALTLVGMAFMPYLDTSKP